MLCMLPRLLTFGPFKYSCLGQTPRIKAQDWIVPAWHSSTLQDEDCKIRESPIQAKGGAKNRQLEPA